MNSSKTYAGIPQEFGNLSTSKIVIIPVPYNGTSMEQKAADRAPQAFLEASENMGLYDIETDSEVYKQGVFLADPVTEDASPEAMVEAVHQITKKYLNRNKFVTIFGGEHSISIGTIRAFNERFDNLTVLHIDAYADLRKEYEGSKYSSACAVYEASQLTNLVQVGIRNMDITEKRTINPEKVFFAQDMAISADWMDDVTDLLTENVFITFDLNVFDPSIMSSTGTPEPGGLLYYETLEFLKLVFKQKNVVGFDMVKLSPNKDEKASDFLVAKLFYKMLSYKFSSTDDSYESGKENKKENSFSKLSKFKNNNDTDY
jgi:agmatinase